MGGDMRNCPAVKDEPRASCRQGVRMKLLVPKRRHIDLLTSHELVKIAKLSTETRGCMIQRKQRNAVADRLERTKFVMEKRVILGLPEDVSG